MANLNETIGRLARPLTSLISLGADKGYLSLDIGSSSIKMVEVHGQGSTLKITNAGIIPLHSDAVQSHCVQDIDRALSVTSEQLLDEIQRSLSFFWTAATEETGFGYIVEAGARIGANGGVIRTIEPGRVVVEEYETDFSGKRWARQRALQLAVADVPPVGGGTNTNR